MASRYWVGGTASWDATAGTKWALTSGGAGGQAVPTSSDDVFFDAASGTNTVTVAATANCLSIDFTGFTGTFAGSSALNVAGSLTLATGMTRTFTGVTTFTATSTGKTITCNGKTFGAALTFNGVGGGWTFQDNVTTTGNINLTAGSLNTNGKNVSCNNVSFSGSTTRSLTLGASTITTNFWSGATTTNLTFNAGTSTITVSSTIFDGGGLTYNIVNLSSSGAIQPVTGANIFATLTITGPSAIGVGVTFAANQTITGTLTMNGNNSTTNRILISSSVVGTARTLTAATVVASNVDFQDITGAGAASWNLSAITGLSGDCGGNSGITFTTATTTVFTNNVSGGSWGTASNWSVRVPLPQDTADMSASFGTALTVSVNVTRMGKDIIWTGATFTTSLTWQILTATTIYGSLALISGLTLTGTQDITFAGRGSHTITMAGKSWAQNINFNGPGGTYTLQDAFTITSNVNLNILAGTFDANGQNVTVNRLTSSGTITRTIKLGSGTWQITAAGVTLGSPIIIQTLTGLTFNAGTSVVKLTDTSSSNIEISSGGLTFYDFWIARGSSTGSVQIDGSNTFHEFKDTGTAAHSILFTNGTTQHITTWTVNGSSGAAITLNSTTTATFALVKDGGGVVSSDWLNIQHSVATPSSTWYAGVNSVNNQGVATAGSGWIFTVPPTFNPAMMAHMQIAAGLI